MLGWHVPEPPTKGVADIGDDSATPRASAAGHASCRPLDALTPPHYDREPFRAGLSLRVIHNRIGEAMKIELYVPTSTPTSSEKAKAWMPCPPPMYRMTMTINVVNDVSNVRLKVWLMLVLIMSAVTWGDLPRTSRIRSKTTIVSLSE